MDLSNKSDLADLALLAMYAEDMHRDMQSVDQKIFPEIDDRLSAEWTVLAFLTAKDAIFPLPGVKSPIHITSEPLYYGYVAQHNADAAQYLVAVRGTEGIAEWIIDGQFLWVDHPAGAKVEHGFWDIYSSMQVVGLDGSKKGQTAAEGIKSLVVGATAVTVVGHSLGSSLATYLSYDLALLLGETVEACLFASPRTGDLAWVNDFHRTVTRYIVVNYVLDVVPHLPTRPGYVTLPNVLLLEPKTADAAIRIDVRCNHHVICYCAMLNHGTAIGVHPKQIDLPCISCIDGDKRMVSDGARSMGEAIQAVASTANHVSALFRAMFNLNI